MHRIDVTDHRIIAQPWQLQAAQEKRLGAVIVPSTGGSVNGDPESLPTRGVECGFSVGDRLYLAEEWAFGFLGGIGICTMPTHYFAPDEILDDIGLNSWQANDPSCTALAGIQPASTMPPKAAEYWYEVMGVRVCQCKDGLSDSVQKVGISPWQMSRWVVELEVKEVANA